MMRSAGIKICGITRVADAQTAVDLGAELVGLNFWPKSPRFVSIEQAKTIVGEVRGRAQLVGLWVNPSRQEVLDVDKELSLDLLQFHGEASRSALDWFPDRVIQAIRLGTDRDSVDLRRYERVWGFLFDCAPAGIYGGSGQAWAYDRIASLETAKPVILAGGLTPENVAAAITQSGADIVDVCSGVEAAPGVKDPRLLERFIKEVRNVETQT